MRSELSRAAYLHGLLLRRGWVDTFAEEGDLATYDGVTRLEMLTQHAQNAVGNLGQLFERLIHPRRRTQARRRLIGQHVSSVLFLCHGNVYRSPYAAASFERALAAMRSPASIKVVSAGFIAPGRPAPEPALNAAQARGIDLSSHRSSLVTAHAVSGADLVAVMSEDQARGIRSRYRHNVTVLILGDLDPLPILSRTITDPWGCDVRILDQVYSRIDRCVEQLAKLIAK